MSHLYFQAIVQSPSSPSAKAFEHHPPSLLLFLTCPLWYYHQLDTFAQNLRNVNMSLTLTTTFSIQSVAEIYQCYCILTDSFLDRPSLAPLPFTCSSAWSVCFSLSPYLLHYTVHNHKLIFLNTDFLVPPLFSPDQRVLTISYYWADKNPNPRSHLTYIPTFPL